MGIALQPSSYLNRAPHTYRSHHLYTCYFIRELFELFIEGYYCFCLSYFFISSYFFLLIHTSFKHRLVHTPYICLFLLVKRQHSPPQSISFCMHDSIVLTLQNQTLCQTDPGLSEHNCWSDCSVWSSQVELFSASSMFPSLLHLVGFNFQRFCSTPEPSLCF